jgi:hypothetical protein
MSVGAYWPLDELGRTFELCGVAELACAMQIPALIEQSKRAPTTNLEILPPFRFIGFPGENQQAIFALYQSEAQGMLMKLSTNVAKDQRQVNYFEMGGLFAMLRLRWRS